MCEKILCQVSVRGAVVFPPVFLLQGPVLVALSLALITTALWDFPVSTDTPSAQIPKQFVLIGLMCSFLWSGPPRLGLAEVPWPASCHHAAHPPTLLVRSLLGASATSPAEGLAALPAAPPGLFVL